MMVKTYLNKHPEIKEFWLESGVDFYLYGIDDFSNRHMNGILGRAKIKSIEEVPDEPVTLHI